MEIKKIRDYLSLTVFFLFLACTIHIIYKEMYKNDKNNIFINHYYINLEERKDRNKLIKNELSKIGIKSPNRFNAIKNKEGAVGCTMSHIEVLKKAKNKNWDYVVVFEDDVLFLNPTRTINKLNKIFNSDIKWDVIILGGNNYKPYEILDEDCIKVSNCQTTTSYIVKKHYYDTMINNFESGLQKLKETKIQEKYAVDQYWKELQKKDTFILITPIEVIQREGYSDIGKKDVDYREMMLDLK